VDGTGRRDKRTTDTRAKIQTVALELFIQQGFSHTTLQDIADRLELTKAALYYHFPTKADLIRSVVQPAVDDVDAFLSEARDRTLSPRELFERFFDLNYTHRLVFLALTRDPSGLASADADNWVPRLAQQFQVLLAGSTPTTAQRVQAVMAASGLSRCATLLTDVPIDELRATSVEIAMRTLDADAAAGSGA
jgi:AcrR family transcriptional regulator